MCFIYFIGANINNLLSISCDAYKLLDHLPAVVVVIGRPMIIRQA